MNAARDSFGNFAKFVPPLVANGRVYVATWSNQVAVYGLIAAAPILSAISPASGPTSGGTAVTLTGQNFASGATVTFGGVAATSVVVVNATQITANTPAHAQGSVNVVVANPDGQSATLNRRIHVQCTRTDPECHLARQRTNQRRYRGDVDRTELRIRRNGHLRRCGGDLCGGGECHADYCQYASACARKRERRGGQPRRTERHANRRIHVQCTRTDSDVPSRPPADPPAAVQR